MTRNPVANIMETVNRIFPPHMVPIQLNIFMPVGTAIQNVLAAKMELSHGGKPTENM